MYSQVKFVNTFFTVKDADIVVMGMSALQVVMILNISLNLNTYKWVVLTASSE